MLASYTDPGDLYLARGKEVNPNRPLFTGDTVSDIRIPGVQDDGPAIVIAHPCSMRGANGQLAERVLVTGVQEREKISRKSWPTGFFDMTPLPELTPGAFAVGHFDKIGQAPTSDVRAATRIACLSETGINLLQQRLTFHLTRASIETSKFHEAFAHTLVEADLLEEWADELVPAGWDPDAAAALFDEFLRAGDPSLQSELLDPQRRASVRAKVRQESRRLSVEESPAGG